MSYLPPVRLTGGRPYRDPSLRLRRRVDAILVDVERHDGSVASPARLERSLRVATFRDPEGGLVGLWTDTPSLKSRPDAFPNPTLGFASVWMVSDEVSAEELRRQQASTERAEQKRATEAVTEDEAAAHRRRAEKAAYLAEKLAEREQSEDDAPDDQP